MRFVLLRRDRVNDCFDPQADEASLHGYFLVANNIPGITSGPLFIGTFVAGTVLQLICCY